MADIFLSFGIPVVCIVFNSTELGWIFGLIIIFIKNHFRSAHTGLNMLSSGFFEISTLDSYMYCLWSDFYGFKSGIIFLIMIFLFFWEKQWKSFSDGKT